MQTTAPGGPQQTGQQQPGQTNSGQPSSPTITVTKTESQCAVPGAGNGAGAAGGPGGGDSSDNNGGTGPDNSDGGDGENQDGAPSWAYLVGEVSALMTGRRGRKAGPLNPDGSAPTNDMIPNDQVDGENYKEWTTPDGKRTFILSENADAPSQYRFNINEVDRPDGGSVDVNDDGTLSTYDRDGNEVDRFTPWAYDTKTGEKIPTSYTRDGDDLIQTINRPEGNNNPILADPPGDDETPGRGGASGEGADNSSPEPAQEVMSTPTLVSSPLPGTYGPFSQEQLDQQRKAAETTKAIEEAAEAQRAQERILGALSQTLPQVQNPTAPTDALGAVIAQRDRDEADRRRQRIEAALMQTVPQVTNPDAPTDPSRLLDEAIDRTTQTEQRAAAELSELIDNARQQILDDRINPALARLREAQALFDDNPNNWLRKQLDEARADLAKAYGELGALPDLAGVSRTGIVQKSGGFFEFVRPDGSKVTAGFNSADGSIITSEDDDRGGSLITVFRPDGTHKARYADPGRVIPMDGWILDLVGTIPIGRVATFGLRRGVQSTGGETAEQAMLRAVAQAEQKATAAGKNIAQIQRNNAAGLEAAKWLERNQYPGAIVDKARFDIPGHGGRRVDLLTDGGKAIEVKTGETVFSKVKDQVAKDAVLNSGAVRGVSSVEWVFMKSVFTGKGGPDQALINALNAAGIKWKVI